MRASSSRILELGEERRERRYSTSFPSLRSLLPISPSLASVSDSAAHKPRGLPSFFILAFAPACPRLSVSISPVHSHVCVCAHCLCRILAGSPAGPK